MELSDNIIAATKEIFSTMVMMEITEGESMAQKSRPLENSISGIIGLAGTHKGVLAIHLPKVVALAITSNFLGMDVEDINEDVEDAVGELANMLGGNVKSFLSGKGRDIELSMPTTIAGKEYHFEPAKEAEMTFVPFKTEAGEFLVELQLEK